jgi:hypothetical protein
MEGFDTNMSKEKGTPAQRGTGSKEPVIQKLHTTGEKNVKIKLNGAAAKKLAAGKRDFLKQLQAKLRSVGV